MRYLALDVGDEYIGVAISDEGGSLARPLEVLRRGSGPASFLQIARIIEAEKVGAIVVGLPLLPDGREGRQVRSTRAYVRGLEKRVSVPIILWDERDSTQEAAETLAEIGARRKRHRERIDAVAAAVILQSFLNEKRSIDREDES
ncbi:MAG TPA: Holliday junction resolvase RuvX [Chloroflexi bacterium]|jgi:putative Holliday junction resolvase|nr:Holliday junction resolvase RuvX [Chloroflexota bacterium]